jgi:hypothetical protein
VSQKSKIHSLRQQLKRAQAHNRSALPGTVYDVATPLSGKSLRSAVQKLVDAQIRPSTQMLDRQAEQARANQSFVQGKLAGFNKFLGDQQASLIGAAQTTADHGVAAQNQIRDDALGALQRAGDAAKARLSEDAAVRGGSFAASAPSAADQIAGRFAEQATSMGERARADASHANTYNTSGQQAIVGQGLANNMRAGEQSTALAGAFGKTISDILSKKGDLAGQRANLTADLSTKLRQSEFNNAVTMEGLGIKKEDLAQSFAATQAKIDETNRHNTAMETTAGQSTMLSDKRYRLDKRKFGAAQAKERYQKKHGLGPYKPAGSPGSKDATPTQKAAAQAKSTKFWAQIDDALHTTIPSIFEALHKHNVDARAGKKDADGNPLVPVTINDKTLTAALKRQGVKDPLLIKAALAGRGHQGRIPAQLSAELVNAGYLVPPKRLQRGKTPVETAAGNAGSILGSIFG